MERFAVECVVIGAGAVGLACARALALEGLEVVVLETGDSIGSVTSSRNSEVIHAGLYYPPSSLKARACVEGKRRLEPYLDQHGVAYRRCGKLVVACAPDETAALAAIETRARVNGAEAISLIDGSEARALEPALARDVCAAILSSGTGILDSHGYMMALAGDLADAGGAIGFKSRVARGRVGAQGVTLDVVGEENTRVDARIVVNAAGLHAGRVAGSIDGLPASASPRLRFAKGNYFAVSGRAPFTRLIYPTPVDGGLGVHLTIDLGGAMRFGPDVEWLDFEDPDAIVYDVDPGRSAQFGDAVRRYWPDFDPAALHPDYAGVRPKLSGPGEPGGDFRIDGPEAHGAQGLVNLFGIESPGMTASLALAEEVVARLKACGDLG